VNQFRTREQAALADDAVSTDGASIALQRPNTEFVCCGSIAPLWKHSWGVRSAPDRFKTGVPHDGSNGHCNIFGQAAMLDLQPAHESNP